MHRVAKHLRRLQQIKLQRDSGRPSSQVALHDAAKSHAVKEAEAGVQTWPWEEKHHSEQLCGNHVNSRDLNVKDLWQTLEAHRKRNKASIIRKIDSVPGNTVYYFKRPLQARDTQKLPIWPAGSIQDRRMQQETHALTGGRSISTKLNEVLEYRGVPMELAKLWNLQHDTPHELQRPWMSYTANSGGDNYQKFVHVIKSLCIA